MLKAIHAQESKKASRDKAKAVVAELRAMKLKEAAKLRRRWPTAIFPVSIGRASAPTMWSSGWTVRSAAEPAWWGHSLTATLLWCWSALGFAMWRARSGAEKIYEPEALGDGAGRRLHCRLTSLSQSLQIILRINLDGTSLTFWGHFNCCSFFYHSPQNQVPEDIPKSKEKPFISKK